MVSSSFINGLVTEVIHHSDNYGYQFQSGDYEIHTNDDEFKELTTDEEDEEVWCPDADTIDEYVNRIPSEGMVSGKTSFFIWSRGIYRNDKIIEMYDEIVESNLVPYASIREHSNGWYSLEVHLPDGSYEAGYILSHM